MTTTCTHPGYTNIGDDGAPVPLHCITCGELYVEPKPPEPEKPGTIEPGNMDALNDLKVCLRCGAVLPGNGVRYHRDWHRSLVGKLSELRSRTDPRLFG